MQAIMHMRDFPRVCLVMSHTGNGASQECTHLRGQSQRAMHFTRRKDDPCVRPTEKRTERNGHTSAERHPSGCNRLITLARSLATTSGSRQLELTLCCQVPRRDINQTRSNLTIALLSGHTITQSRRLSDLFSQVSGHSLTFYLEYSQPSSF